MESSSGQHLFVDQAFQRAVQLHQSGQLAQAEELYRKVLAEQPAHVSTLHCLGLLAGQTRRLEMAVEMLGKAVACQPDYAAAWSDLGTFLLEKGEVTEAIRACERASSLNPRNPQAHYNLGNALLKEKRDDEAIGAYRRAIALNPAFAEARLNLGGVLQARGQTDQAIAEYLAALAINSKFAEAHNRLGNALAEKGRLDEAGAAYRRAIEINPDSAEFQYNLGSVLLRNHLPDEAAAANEKAIALNPMYAEAYNNLGNAWKDKGELEKALAAYRRAVGLKPDYVGAHSNLVYATCYDLSYDEQWIATELSDWNEQHAKPLEKLIQPHLNDRDPERRLRIGYVSPDFCAHCQALFMLPLLRSHNHGAFEIFCYADVPVPDGITAMERNCADVWRDISGMDHDRAAKLIREDRIDVLVDLTMHMSRGRPLLFARKPAPVQVAWLAYPGSTGMTAIDYRLSDPYLDPPGADESIYSEKTLRLPDTFWCYEAQETSIEVNELPARSTGYITFGCLNNFCKINYEVQALWAGVLRAVPDSRLLLLAPRGKARAWPHKLFTKLGVSAERVEFVDYQPRGDYLQTYHRIDIGLDTFPYNGHTTSLDSFWMGVPVVTRIGATVVGRAGWSQLSNLGLTELAATDDEQFISIAARLASDRERLSQLRSGLRQRMQISPLMDSPKFARNIEASYRQMWRAWCGA